MANTVQSVGTIRPIRVEHLHHDIITTILCNVKEWSCWACFNAKLSSSVVCQVSLYILVLQPVEMVEM